MMVTGDAVKQVVGACCTPSILCHLIRDVVSIYMQCVLLCRTTFCSTIYRNILDEDSVDQW